MKNLFSLFLSLILTIGISQSGWSLRPIYPQALKHGDTIAVIAPAGELNEERTVRAIHRLEEMGFKVKHSQDLYRQRGYLAGSDERRAEELMNAFKDPAVKAISPGTGGYGVTRMVDQLDFKTIRKNPKILHGFSDITGLHLAIGKKTGLVTFHGPNIMYGLGSEGNLTDFSAKYQWKALLASSYENQQGDSVKEGYTYQLPKDATPLAALSSGMAQGRLVGGNLSLISPLIGTDYDINTKNKILFLEDVREDPYRIDRYLSHLRLAGKLDHLSGVLLGMFRKCETDDPQNSLTLKQVFNDYFSDLGVPVIMNFPAGHVKYNATLPMGCLIQLDANNLKVSLLENPVKF